MLAKFLSHDKILYTIKLFVGVVNCVIVSTFFLKEKLN